MECIILAGGLGTRLRPVTGALPKCMVPVAGRPFLHYLLARLVKEGCTRIILSLGYGSEVVEEYAASLNLRGVEIVPCVEPEPMGTGGAIRLALEAAVADTVFVVNGDTIFDISLDAMAKWHFDRRSSITIGLKRMLDSDRYGTVTLNQVKRILSFEEKAHRAESLISGGVYAIEREQFLYHTPPGRAFSMEKDFLEPSAGTSTIYGLESKGYFIDIGIPEDYARAQEEAKRWPSL